MKSPIPSRTCRQVLGRWLPRAFRTLPSQPRALPALVILFVIAGILRLTLGAIGIGGALAQGATNPADAPMTERPPAAATAADDGQTRRPAPASAEPGGAGSPSGLPTDTDAADLAAMLIDLRAREAALEARAERLAERLALLAGAEDRLQRQIDSLRQAEAELDATMTRADRIAAEDLAQLVAVFEAMRPEQAGQIFAEMEPGFAAGFLAQLRPVTAAEILAGLEPALAYALSVTLAGRNAVVPRRPAADAD